MRIPMNSPRGSRPAGPYSHAVRVDNLLFVSGQGPFDAAGGRVGTTFGEQCHAVFDNLAMIAEDCGTSLEQMVRLGAFLRTLDHFAEFNRIAETRLVAPYPTRTTVPVELPGFDIELDAVFWVPPGGIAMDAPNGSIGRVAHDGEVWLARLRGDVVDLLASERLGDDVVRSALRHGVDLANAPARSTLPTSEVRVLAPVGAPSKVICVGLNYRDHATESGIEVPAAPLLFSKAPSSIVGPNDPILIDPSLTEQVDYEAELALVIGRRASRVSLDDALDHVLGVTLCNDVSARDVQFADGQWTRGKSFDTFCPIGPWIVPLSTFEHLGSERLTATLNGQVLQDAPIDDMIFGCAELVSYISQGITLEPGDVIATGTPPGVGFARTPAIFLGAGDTIEVGLGDRLRLANVVRERHRS